MCNFKKSIKLNYTKFIQVLKNILTMITLQKILNTTCFFMTELMRRPLSDSLVVIHAMTCCVQKMVGRGGHKRRGSGCVLGLVSPALTTPRAALTPSPRPLASGGSSGHNCVSTSTPAPHPSQFTASRPMPIAPRPARHNPMPRPPRPPQSQQLLIIDTVIDCY